MKGLTHHKTLKLLLTVALLLAGAIFYISHQPDNLARYKARLAAAGEELSLSKLAPAYSPEAANHHRDINDVAAKLKFSPIPPADIRLMTKTSGGIASVAWNQPTPAHPQYGTWDDFAVQMDESEPAFVELRRLLAASPEGASYDLANPFIGKSAFDFVSRRKTTQVLAGAVVHELHQKRREAALDNLNALISLARLRDESGLLVGQMIHIAIGGMAISATWETLQASGWTEEQLASLQSAWQSLDHARSFARTVELERAFAITCYERCRTNAMARRQIFGGSSGTGSLRDTLYESIYLPVWAKTWSRRDELRFLENMQPIVEGVRRASRSGDYHAFRTTLAEAMRSFKARQSALDEFRFPMAAMVVPNWEKAATSLLRYETQRQMVLTAIALKRCQIRKSDLPENLSALVPNLLPSLPTDYMNGRQLAYHRLSDQRFTLRSVGVNERDDQGADDDLIWPEPETNAISQAASAD